MVSKTKVGNRIYTVEAMEVEKPASIRSPEERIATTAATVQEDPTPVTPTDSSITNILREFAKINPQEFGPKVDENGEPLPSEIQKFLNHKGK